MLHKRALRPRPVRIPSTRAAPPLTCPQHPVLYATPSENDDHRRERFAQEVLQVRIPAWMKEVLAAEDAGEPRGGKTVVEVDCTTVLCEVDEAGADEEGERVCKKRKLA